MAVSPQWRGPGKIYGFDLNGQSHRLGWAAAAAAAKTPTEPAFPMRGKQRYLNMEPRRH